MKIYADYNATAPILTSVKDYLLKRLVDGPYANPHATHHLGQMVHKTVENCRKKIAQCFNVSSDQIIFTSGNTESIAIYFHSTIGQEFLQGTNSKKKKILCSTIEHSSVINNCLKYKKMGAEIIWIPVNSQGLVDLEIAQEYIKKHHAELALVCCMTANNETGALQPFRTISQYCREFSIPFLSDTAQSIGKEKIDFVKDGLTFLTISGHKIGAPFGSGLIIVDNPEKLQCLIPGGKQEREIRGGTLNYIGIETLALAIENQMSLLEDWITLEKHKLFFENEVLTAIPEAIVISKNTPRLQNTTLLAIPGLHGQAIQIELETHNIFVTTSSACSDNDPRTSQVLQAMKIDDATGRSVVRISTCYDFTKENYTYLAEKIIQSYRKLKQIKY